MKSQPLLIMGLVHQNDQQRTESQRTQASALRMALRSSGYEVLVREESVQELGSPGDLSPLLLRVVVFRRLWAQETHHLREARRRQGRKVSSLDFRKYRRALLRTFASVVSRRDAERYFKRLEVEAALSLKHLAVWRRVVEEGAIGALVLEDDFLLSGRASPREVAKLIAPDAVFSDLIDLAGGLERDELGLPTSSDDLLLPYLVANTTCAYWMSARACSALVDLLRYRPEVVYLAPDFLITELNATGFTGSSLLPYKLPLVHGSRAGAFESSIPYV